MIESDRGHPDRDEVFSPCALCGRPLYVRLSRDREGVLRRDLYCALCDAAPGTADVTATAGRRARKLAAEARELAQGAA